MRVEWHYYLDSRIGGNYAPIRVLSKLRPNKKNAGKIGCFRPVEEWNGKKWVMSSAPEITLSTLSNLSYVGTAEKKTIHTENQKNVCKSDNPNHMCSNCDCWKMTRKMCGGNISGI